MAERDQFRSQKNTDLANEFKNGVEQLRKIREEQEETENEIAKAMKLLNNNLYNIGEIVATDKDIKHLADTLFGLKKTFSDIIINHYDDNEKIISMITIQFLKNNCQPVIFQSININYNFEESATRLSEEIMMVFPPEMKEKLSGMVDREHILTFFTETAQKIVEEIVNLDKNIKDVLKSNLTYDEQVKKITTFLL